MAAATASRFVRVGAAQNFARFKCPFGLSTLRPQRLRFDWGPAMWTKRGQAAGGVVPEPNIAGFKVRVMNFDAE